MQQTLLSSLIPSYSNGFDSIVGGINLIGVATTVILFLFRKDNRLRIYRSIGFIDRSTDLLKERLERDPFKPRILWENVALLVNSHVVSMFGLYFLVSTAKWATVWWFLFIFYGGLFSVAGGSHMLYAHRSFKAGTVYQVVIVLLNSMAMSNSIIHWSRDHRAHHKFTDTAADHTNRKRGLFFSHFGWLMLEKHPDVIRAGRKLDLSDLENNPILAFQAKYLGLLYLIFAFIVPVGVPCYLWNERIWTAIHICHSLPWCLNVNSIGFVNSWFHSEGWGQKGSRPYNHTVTATDGGIWRHFVTLGSGNHNFHHAFPQDYSESEFDSPLLFKKKVIDFCALLGLVWDLRKVNPELVKKRKLRGMEKEELSF